MSGPGGLTDNAHNTGIITVGIDAEQYRKIVDDLIGELPTTAESILKRSINATAKRVGRELSTLAKDRYRVKKTRFSDQITYHLASNGDLTAEIVARGEMLAASYFQMSPAKPDKPTIKGSKPVKLAVLKSESPSTVTHPGTGLTAFLTEFASGHVAVVQRKPPKTYTSAGWRKRQQKHAGFKKATGKLDNTRIRQFFGPSVPTMLEQTGITQQYIDENRTKIKGYLEDYILTFLARETYFSDRNK